MDWVLRYGVGKACQIIPTTLYKMAGVEGQVQTGVRMGHKQGSYTMRFRNQFTDRRLFGTDRFSIGGRYSVRGFSGEETLRGDSAIMYKMNGHYHLETTNYSICRDRYWTCMGPIYRNSIR